MLKEENPMKSVKLTQKLTESGLMIALATILSIVKIVELPYGGSITFASMLPLIIVAYRYGFGWGALCGFVFGVIQMILGMNNVSYATSIVAAAAIILLDYIFAFMSTSLGAVFRFGKKSYLSFGFAAFSVCLVRYIFHVISGCTVWAGLSIPTGDALIYSLIYNATYMIPETIITVAAAMYIASVLDFSRPNLRPAKTEHKPLSVRILNIISGLTAVGAIVTAVAMVFPKLQNAESGEFDITGIAGADFTALYIVLGCAAALIIVLQIVKIAVSKKEK